MQCHTAEHRATSFGVDERVYNLLLLRSRSAHENNHRAAAWLGGLIIAFFAPALVNVELSLFVAGEGRWLVK